MRLARYQADDQVAVGYFRDGDVVPLTEAASLYQRSTGERLVLADSTDVLDFLPPDGRSRVEAAKLGAWLAARKEPLPAEAIRAAAAIRLLVPIPRPNKLFLLAGNYAAHIEEGGGRAAARAETFPYVFMKPPSTTLTHPGDPVVIPKNSPDHVDWELELAVVIGRRIKNVPENEALAHVAGYTIVNDISDREFRPNPGRKPREKDSFFDWLHGKWHDRFCPCGPCVVSADAIADPQSLPMELRVNGVTRQKATTAQQIFPVAAVIAFVSSIVTLEPGDIISTGTPAGVGHSAGTYLKAGDRMEATIGSIGTLMSPVIGE
ncbi:MAG: FAA hydrolase family protein [Planctomycetes bacterium]|nr:FAA hydrolase family protein [Planctomycetota bacterium]